jgi:mono/diheme cytochrome c family protein
MRTVFVGFLALALVGSVACSSKSVSLPKATAYGAALVESSGGKQVGGVGTTLTQPLVVQVNDDQGNAVVGALIVMHGPAGTSFDPAAGLSDASGQLTTNVTLGSVPGRYQLRATTTSKAGKEVELKLEEIALGYQETVGFQLSEQYCARCHNPESTPERVSNVDNLDVKPHAFTDGETLNKMSDADLVSIITFGGAAQNKSALMPPYGYTLNKSQVQALVAYIRVVSDPANGTPGIVYTQK